MGCRSSTSSGPKSNVEKDLLLRWKVKTPPTKRCGRQFLDRYVPKVLELGFTFPTPVPFEQGGHWLVADRTRLAAARGDQAKRGPETERRLAAARKIYRRAPWVRKRSPSPPYMPVMEVSRSSAPGHKSPFEHCGAVIAPDPEMAPEMGKDAFSGAGSGRAPVGVVRRSDPSTPTGREPLAIGADKSYRFAAAYRDVVPKREAPVGAPAS